MEDLLYLIIAAALGFMVGWKVNAWITVISMRSILEDLGISQEQMERLHAKAVAELANPTDGEEEEFTVIDARLELMNGVLYCWQKDNGNFLGQGKTREELIEVLSTKHVGYRILIAEADGGELMGGTSYNYDVKTKELTTHDDTSK